MSQIFASADIYLLVFTSADFLALAFAYVVASVDLLAMEFAYVVASVDLDMAFAYESTSADMQILTSDPSLPTTHPLA